MNILLEGVGFLAGGIVTSAALPRVVDMVRDPSKARGESRARNAMLVVGNLIWTVYGIAGDALAIAVMCGLARLLNEIILVAAIRSNRCSPGRPAPPGLTNLGGMGGRSVRNDSRDGFAPPTGRCRPTAQETKPSTLVDPDAKDHIHSFVSYSALSSPNLRQVWHRLDHASRFRAFASRRNASPYLAQASIRHLAS